MTREDDLIVEKEARAGLRCPNCQSQDWVKDGSSLTFILKTYKCNDCDTHWLMFTEEHYKKAKELNK